MAIGQLIKLIPPSSNPMDVGRADKWKSVEELLGIVFPEDYKSLIDLYGSGSFGEFLSVLNPFSTYYDYVQEVKSLLKIYEELKSDFPEYYTFAVFPEARGVFPWATTDNGDELYWETANDSRIWSIVYYPSRDTVFEQFEMTTTEFLSLWFSGDLKSKLITKKIIPSWNEYNRR